LASRYAQLGGVQGALARQANAALTDATTASGRSRERLTHLGHVESPVRGQPARRVRRAGTGKPTAETLHGVPSPTQLARATRASIAAWSLASLWENTTVPSVSIAQHHVDADPGDEVAQPLQRRPHQGGAGVALVFEHPLLGHVKPQLLGVRA
jgi:hypothetical protein